MGKVTRCETAAAGLDNASIGKDRWIGGYGTSLRGRPCRRPKNRGDGGYEAKTGTLAGTLHCLPQPSRGGEGRRRPRSVAVRVNARLLRARSERFAQDRWHASVGAKRWRQHARVTKGSWATGFLEETREYRCMSDPSSSPPLKNFFAHREYQPACWSLPHIGCFLRHGEPAALSCPLIKGVTT